MVQKTILYRSIASILVLLASVVVAAASGKSVYQLADGIVRPSALKGAMEAYLPMIFPSSHASNLLALPNGDLLCFFFSGTEEGESGISILMSRLNHGSNRWTAPAVLSYRNGWSNQNPVPFRAPDGRLWLFHTSQVAGKGQTTAVIFSLTSDDEGLTWTAPQTLFPQPGSFDRQPLVIFHKEWLFPVYHSASAGIVKNAQNDYSAVKISKDHGKTWSECRVPGSGGLVQMNIAKLSNGNLAAFFRSRYADWVYKSASDDGCNWSPPAPTRLPNNNASIQVARLEDGHLVIAFNNAQATKTRGQPRTAPRTILSVALSIDGGKTWPWVRDIQAGNEPPKYYPAESPEYSYPSVTQSPDGKIQLTFTFRRETIKYVTFDEQWIKDGSTIGLFKGDPKP